MALAAMHLLRKTRLRRHQKYGWTSWNDHPRRKKWIFWSCITYLTYITSYGPKDRHY